MRTTFRGGVQISFDDLSTIWCPSIIRGPGASATNFDTQREHCGNLQYTLSITLHLIVRSSLITAQHSVPGKPWKYWREASRNEDGIEYVIQIYLHKRDNRL